MRTDNNNCLELFSFLYCHRLCRTVAALRFTILGCCVSFCWFGCASIRNRAAADPNFSSPIANITIPIGREAVMTCVVHDLYSYKVRMYLKLSSSVHPTDKNLNHIADATVAFMLLNELILEFVMHTIRNMLT